MIKKRVLITGATGFFGKNLAKHLIKEKYKVYLTSANGDRKNNIISLDLLDIKNIKNKIKLIKPEIIYHLAGIVNLSRDIESAKKCIEVNIKSSLNLLESLKEYVPQKFIYTSTEEVYGEGKIPYEENQELYPPSGYAISKVAIEHFCRNYSKDLGFQVIINRIGTSYGPGDLETRFIPQMIKKAIKNVNIPLNSGKKERDYIYIDDVIDALHIEGKKNIKNKFEIINIGGGVSYSLLDVFKIIKKCTNSKSKVLLGILPERKLESKRWLLDIRKAGRLLRWKPKTSLDNGLGKTVEYYREIIE